MCVVQVVKRLLDDKVCDINFMPNDDKIKIWHSPISTCCSVLKGFDSSRPAECENYQIFDTLLSHDDLDLSIENHSGENAIELLQKHKSKEYLELLKTKAKSNKYAWSKKYTIEKIQKEIRTNETATELTDAAGLSVYTF